MRVVNCVQEVVEGALRRNLLLLSGRSSLLESS
jgi:hypothetical protein